MPKPADVRLELLAWLDEQPDHFARILDVPERLLNPDLFTVCDSEGLVEFRTLEPGQPKGWEHWSSRVGTDWLPMPDILHAVRTGQNSDRPLLIRMTGKGMATLAQWRISTGGGQDVEQANFHVENLVIGDQITAQGSTVVNHSTVKDSFNTTPDDNLTKAVDAASSKWKRAFAWFRDNIVAKVASGLIVAILMVWIMTELWPWIKSSLGLE